MSPLLSNSFEASSATRDASSSIEESVTEELASMTLDSHFSKRKQLALSANDALDDDNTSEPTGGAAHDAPPGKASSTSKDGIFF
jgi:hypothetical protein